MPPVRPRDAASLIPYKSGPEGLLVLMGRRAKAHKFLPNYYVFPGGRVDAADRARPHASDLRPEVATLLGEHCSAREARALAIAAARETFEETGLAIGMHRDGALAPALDRLDYVLRAITPAANPIRFHARFFTARIGEADGVVRGNGELLDLDWRPIDACMRLPIADITEYLLESLHALTGANRPRTAPLFCFQRGRVKIRDGAGPARSWVRMRERAAAAPKEGANA